MKPSFRYGATVLALVGVAIVPVYADVWSERAALAQIASELTALERLVSDAQKLSENDARVKFDYDVLMRDLEVIRSGINTHLSQPINPVMPSRVDALGGEYTEKNK
ncbi:integrative conjugative element protein, RAQPRD family [Marinobacterium weihaiense]|jgi:RAQPRD family integrative conjugative element protein|uniref:RAQPRD family integrative conjugative element protein n=1 Tax=Marinobacterium weihaiense TaxID=2851016 RepID=A0ABS6MEB1_9GAMM|nr:RAQPRD family integrative conjugative element protein [Marinobacterium weihaiense]MBV0934166.1 RAQPRD family integrative conjugative element protein [Marinobacterium weihaiense]